MVKVAYEDLNSFYDDIKSITCGRKSCSVLILVANEVSCMNICRQCTCIEIRCICIRLMPFRQQECSRSYYETTTSHTGSCNIYI